MFRWRKRVDDKVLNEYLQKAEALSKSRAFDEAKKNYEKAVERCDELLKQAPGNDYLHCRKARVLFELRRYEGPDWTYVKRCREALVEIDRAIELDPEDNEYHLRRSDILGELGGTPDWSLNAGPDEERTMDTWLLFFSLSHYIRGFMVDERGIPFKCMGNEYKSIDIRLIETKDEYESRLKENPNDPDRYNNLAAAMHELGMWDMRADPRVLEKLNKAIALNPDNPAYYNNRALVLYSLIMDAEYFRHRMDGWPKDKLDPEKTLQDVYRDLSRAVEQDTHNPYYHYNMGLMLYGDGRYNQAIDELDKAIALDSSNHYFHYKKGMVLYRLGKNDEAIECFKEALGLYKKDLVARYMIKLIERIRDRERGVTLPVVTTPEWVGDDTETKVFLQSGDLKPDEAISRARELISIAKKFNLIDSNISQKEMEKLEKRLSEILSKKEIRLNSLMLTLCFHCPAYWFDTEMIYGPEDYVELASELSRITRGLLPLSGIDCRKVMLPGEESPEKYLLSFIAGGEKHTVELPFKDDWAQYGPIVRVLNNIAGKIGRRERYVSLNTMDQTACLIFCISEDYEAFRKTVVELLRQWSLLDTKEN